MELALRSPAPVPGFPRVPENPAVGRRVGRQPAVGGVRAEVEFGPEPVQRRTGRRDPPRVRVLRPEDRLLGVRAPGGGDQQRDAVGGRGRREAVEGLGDVGPHPLTLALGERPGVLAAGRRGGVEGARRELRLGTRHHLRRRPRPAALDGDLASHLDADADRSDRVRVREGDGHRRSRRCERRRHAPPPRRAAGRRSSDAAGSDRRLNRRGCASSIARAPASAARSADRCASERPPIPRATAPSTNAPTSSPNSPPRIRIAACPACLLGRSRPKRPCGRFGRLRGLRRGHAGALRAARGG